jgi:hypothetical protein
VARAASEARGRGGAARPAGGSRRAQWAVAVVLGAYAAFSLTIGARHALAPRQSQDLAPVYMAARLWLQGENPYREHTPEDWLRASRAGEVPTDAIQRAYATPYAPMAVLVVSGIAALEWETAKVVWLTINLALAVYVAWLLFRLWFHAFHGPLAAVLIAVWFGGIGLRVGLGNGQHTLVWLAAILTMIRLMASGHRSWAGVFFALSLHKYPLTTVFVPFLARHRHVRLLGAATLASLAALAVFVAGLDAPVAGVTESYARELSWWYSQTGESSLQAQGLTDFRPVLAAIMPGHAATAAMYVLTALALVAVCWPREDAPSAPGAIDLAAIALLLLFATYHRVYDTVVLILPLMVLVRQWPGPAGWGGSGLRTLTLLMAMAWYADPSAIYRRIAPMTLDTPPDTGAFIALDLTYRAVIATSLVVIAARRLQRVPSRALLPGTVES